MEGTGHDRPRKENKNVTKIIFCDDPHAEYT